MSPQLSRRLALAFDKALPAEQIWLRDAAGPADVREVADMPAEARKLLAEVESRAAMPLPRGVS